MADGMNTRTAAAIFALSQVFSRPRYSLIIVLIRMLAGRLIKYVMGEGIFIVILVCMQESGAITWLDSHKHKVQ